MLKLQIGQILGGLDLHLLEMVAGPPNHRRTIQVTLALSYREMVVYK